MLELKNSQCVFRMLLQDLGSRPEITPHALLEAQMTNALLKRREQLARLRELSTGIVHAFGRYFGVGCRVRLETLSLILGPCSVPDGPLRGQPLTRSCRTS